MIAQRLRMALENLQPSDWQRFEQLASTFLASEFENLRTMASASGDEGRDSELFGCENESKVVLQYSVAGDWADKVHRTVKRLEETHQEATILIYVSNQLIGARADSLRRELRRDKGLALDVRDRNWFVERVLGSTACEQAAEELSTAIVDPLLASAGVQPRTPSELTSPEAVAAFTYLGLQWQDDIREKGLTKLAFEALVRGVLAGTDSDHRLSRESVRGGVQALLPGHSASQVKTYVDSALERLTKRVVRHWQKEDEFCLAHEEVLRLIEYKTLSAVAETSLGESIKTIARAVLSAQGVQETHLEQVAKSTRISIDAILLARSQAFAIAVQSGSLSSFAADDFKEALVAEVSRSALPKLKDVDWLNVLGAAVREVLTSDEPAITAHLRSLADSYTLLAFLRQTPDVQKAVEKMFSVGKIWLDTSIVLPLIAETLDEDDLSGRFTRMIGAAREAGLELYVTSGVLEEIETPHESGTSVCAEVVQLAGCCPISA